MDDEHQQLRIGGGNSDVMATYSNGSENRTATASSRQNGNSVAVTDSANNGSNSIAAETDQQPQPNCDVMQVSVLDELYAVVASGGDGGGGRGGNKLQQSQQLAHRRKHSGRGGEAIEDVDLVLKSTDGHGGGDDDDAVDGSGGIRRVRHRHRRPLYRRLISYMRSAWTAGVNFSSSNGTAQKRTHILIHNHFRICH